MRHVILLVLLAATVVWASGTVLQGPGGAFSVMRPSGWGSVATDDGYVLKPSWASSPKTELSIRVPDKSDPLPLKTMADAVETEFSKAPSKVTGRADLQFAGRQAVRISYEPEPELKCQCLLIDLPQNYGMVVSVAADKDYDRFIAESEKILKSVRFRSKSSPRRNR